MDYKTLLENVILTQEQRHAIYSGMNEAAADFEKFKDMFSDSATEKGDLGVFYDRLNTKVKESFNKKTQMKIVVESKRAWYHPYHLYRDTIRNIIFLVLPFSSRKNIFEPSNYRGNISIANISRIKEEGLFDILFKQREIIYQDSLQPLGINNQPFGLIVTYDIHTRTMNEGALLPDQSDWIFKLENTHKYLEGLTFNNVVPMYNDNESFDGHKIKPEALQEVDIPLKLKNDPTS